MGRKWEWIRRENFQESAEQYAHAESWKYKQKDRIVEIKGRKEMMKGGKKWEKEKGSIQCLN